MAELRPVSAPPRHGSASRSTFSLRLGLLLLTLSLFGCDHATKLAAEQGLSHGRAMDLVSGVLELRLTPNPDTAFSLLRTFGIARSPQVLIAVSAFALAAVVIMWMATRRHATRAQHLGYALILAGALGNVVDRAMRGYVVDFIHLTYWPVFNVADIAVVAGVILLGLGAFIRRNRASQPPLPDAPA